MILSDFHFYSPTLGVQTAAYVLLPEYEPMRTLKGEPLPTLYLLHGLSDDHTAWLRQTAVARYASRYAVAVVMPAVNRSFYADMAHGPRYWTFVSEELPNVMETYFPLCKTREGRFAAGLSMGGYGAMKLGLRLPGRYAAVASLSGPLMMHQAYQFPEKAPDMRELNDVFGGDKRLRSDENNLALLAQRLSPADAPRIYAACGTADFLFDANEAFMARFGKKLHIDYHTEEGVAHTWDFWDRQIEKVLAWLPLTRVENGR